MMAAINRARASLTSTHRANTATTSNPRPTGSTPYLTSHSAGTSQQGVLAAIRGLSKKQDDMFEKLLDLERKVLTFMQDSFDITKTSYYATFIEEMAKAYCSDLKREVSLSNMQVVSTKCLGSDARSKSIFSVAISKFKERMNYFRAEERRKLIGNSPYESYHNKSTLEITDAMMRSMKAPMSIRDIYVRHVAMARKYIRTLEDRNNFSWTNFRKWINLYYPDQDTIDWVEILSEDEATVLPTPPLHDQLYFDTDGAEEVFSDNIP